MKNNKKGQIIELKIKDLDFTEFSSIHNLCKTKFFISYYDCYNKKISDIEQYINTWYYFEKFVYKKTFNLYTDSLSTLKKVDNDSKLHLYEEEINPVSLMITEDYKDNSRFSMKATIHSIDDSSYGIWFNSKSLDVLQNTRIKFMQWINTQKVLSGEEFLNTALELDANENTIDYN